MRKYCKFSGSVQHNICVQLELGTVYVNILLMYYIGAGLKWKIIIQCEENNKIKNLLSHLSKQNLKIFIKQIFACKSHVFSKTQTSTLYPVLGFFRKMKLPHSSAIQAFLYSAGSRVTGYLAEILWLLIKWACTKIPQTAGKQIADH